MTKGPGRQGTAKQKWQPSEEDALRKGVLKYGAGKWRAIQKDSELGAFLKNRTNVDLKDKWRNMNMDSSTSRDKHRKSAARSRGSTSNRRVKGSKRKKGERKDSEERQEELSSRQGLDILGDAAMNIESVERNHRMERQSRRVHRKPSRMDVYESLDEEEEEEEEDEEGEEEEEEEEEVEENVEDNGEMEEGGREEVEEDAAGPAEEPGVEVKANGAGTSMNGGHTSSGRVLEADSSEPDGERFHTDLRTLKTQIIGALIMRQDPDGTTEEELLKTYEGTHGSRHPQTDWKAAVQGALRNLLQQGLVRMVTVDGEDRFVLSGHIARTAISGNLWQPLSELPDEKYKNQNAREVRDAAALAVQEAEDAARRAAAAVKRADDLALRPKGTPGVQNGEDRALK